MMSILSALLCLGLSLDQGTGVQAGKVFIPTICAQPNSEKSLKLWCQGFKKNLIFHLYKEEKHMLQGEQTPQETSVKGKSSNMTEHSSGRYRCYCLSPGRSEHSDPLDLVLTGSYTIHRPSDKPRVAVTSGGSRILPCISPRGRYWLVLRKKGDRNISWILYSKPYEEPHAIFTPGLHLRTFIPQGNFHSIWAFVCNNYFSNDPQECPHPSEPMKFLGSGPTENQTPTTTLSGLQRGANDTLSPSPNNSDPKITSHPEDYTVGNLIRMGVAGLVLVVLGVLLFQA